jgi:hypothetical protein
VSRAICITAVIIQSQQGLIITLGDRKAQRHGSRTLGPSLRTVRPMARLTSRVFNLMETIPLLWLQ